MRMVLRSKSLPFTRIFLNKCRASKASLRPFQGFLSFGASNQLVATLALFVVSCWLLSKNKPTNKTLYPAIFMLITTLAALGYQFINHLRNGDYLLLGITVTLVVLALVMTFEVVNVFRKKRIK